MTEMDQEIFQKYKQIIYRECGIVLSNEKMPLLANRLRKILISKGINDEREYLKFIETDLSGNELIQLVEAISTNTTQFYREENHFPILSDIIGNLVDKGKKEIKIWCAAASSGEEPYTILFTTLESIGKKKINLRMLATDINTKVLSKAAQGVYPNAALKNVPEKIKEKYFTKIEHNNLTYSQVKEEFREKILFKKLNLISFPYALKGEIDVIFCRNVMIYFDIQTRQKIISQFEKLMAKDSYLFISHAESLLGIDTVFEKYKTSVFRKN